MIHREPGDIGEVTVDFNPISYLESTPFERLTPGDAQDAINAIEAGSPMALVEAEVILGVVSHIAASNPTADWDEVHERAWKIYCRERDYKRGSDTTVLSDTLVKFPETAEEESARVNSWLSQNEEVLSGRLLRIDHRHTPGSQNLGFPESTTD